MPAAAPGLRGRLFLLSVGLVAGAVVAAGLYLEPRLVRWIEERTWSDLLHRAETSRLLVEYAGAGDLRVLTARLAVASDARITIAAPDGRRLGDSMTPSPSRVKGPEIDAAFAGEVGRGRRVNPRTGVETLYLAVPWPRGDGHGAIRVAIPAAAMEHGADTLRAFLSGAALIGLAAAALLSGLASVWFARWMRGLVARIRTLVAQTGTTPAPERAGDLGGLAGTVGRMAGELERTVVTLAAERARFEAVVEALDEGVMATDAAGVLVLANTAARRLLGLPGDAIGRPMLGFVRTPALVEIARAAEGGEARTGECRTGPGQDRLLVARAAPLAQSGGVVLAVRDITELRRLEGIRRDFVANVSHEIRTPLSVIRANAETLLDGGLEDPGAARTFTGAIHRQAERLARLVDDLLDLARIESGRLDLDIRLVPLADAIHRVIDGLRPMADARDHDLRVEVAAGLSVRADPDALDHAVSNLVDNAIKYTPPGGHIRIWAEPEGDRVRVGVMDDGPGIPARQRDRIFERFYRVDPGRSRDRGGTGLGLSIVKHLLTAMDGELGVVATSPDDATRPGSTFWFTLPAA